MEKDLYNILLQSKGKIDNFVFIASISYGTELKEYEGIPIYYNNLIQKDIIIYCQNPYIKDKNELIN